MLKIFIFPIILYSVESCTLQALFMYCWRKVFRVPRRTNVYSCGGGRASTIIPSNDIHISRRESDNLEQLVVYIKLAGRSRCQSSRRRFGLIKQCVESSFGEVAYNATNSRKWKQIIPKTTLLHWDSLCGHSSSFKKIIRCDSRYTFQIELIYRVYSPEETISLSSRCPNRMPTQAVLLWCSLL